MRFWTLILFCLMSYILGNWYNVYYFIASTNITCTFVIYMVFFALPYIYFSSHHILDILFYTDIIHLIKCNNMYINKTALYLFINYYFNWIRLIWEQMCWVLYHPDRRDTENVFRPSFETSDQVQDRGILTSLDVIG